jgi:mono/diheme cytochrome c family protein
VPWSRRRLGLVVVTLLLALDLGRSVYARLGAATPSRLWSPDPTRARAVAWPPGSEHGPDSPLGERLYARHCAICHGPDGRGNGPAAPSLHPRPRDFTGGVFKLKSTAGSEAPTLADVRRTIEQGMPGSSMPAWRDLLSREEIDALAEYVRSLGPHESWGRASPLSNGPAVVSLEDGRAAYEDLGCPACHGEQGRGDGAAARELRDAWGQPDPPRDLTAPWTFRGGDAPEAVYARTAFGMSGTPMPGYAEVAEPGQIAGVIAYIRAIARTPPWEPGGQLAGAGQSLDAVERGRYLVRATMCGLCHTPVDSAGIYLADSHYLAGGMRIDAGAHGVFFSRNLTPDESGLGEWSAEQIAAAIRGGHARERRLSFWAMPWQALGMFTQDDALAIARYLQTLPPVRSWVPPPLRYGFVETVLRKLTYPWPQASPQRLAYWPGNYGEASTARFRRALPQTVLTWAQLAVLVAGVVTLPFARRRPRATPSRGRTLLVASLLFAGAAVGTVVDRYPAITTLPADQIIGGFASTIPAPEMTGRPPHEAALLERGRYLYGVASCAFCHNGDGSGGAKINSSAFGTTWVQNLTSHPQALLGWSDDAVLRAITSGVRSDGRALHWQAMLWDHLSNFSADDSRALLRYLRSLPSVERRVPEPVAPRPDDCAAYTFWVRDSNHAAGCR